IEEVVMRGLRHVGLALAIGASVGCGDGAPDGGAAAAGDPASSPGGAASPPPAGGGAVKLALAPKLPAQCTGPEVFRIERPIAASDPSRGTFSYGYRFKAPSAAGAPVLVYLPGGPGMTSTDTVPEFLPKGWGYLLTDPRGTGCNTLAQVPDPSVSPLFFRTE